MHANVYQDWSYYYSNIFVVFLGKQLLKIVGNQMPIIVDKDPYTSSENFISGEDFYRPNSNDLARTLILPNKSANLLEKFVEVNNLIYLVKPLIICSTPMFLQFFKCTHAVIALSFVCDNKGSKTGNNTGHSISRHTG